MRYQRILSYILGIVATLLIFPNLTKRELEIKFKALVYEGNTTSYKTISLSTNNTIFYSDAWRAHWCQYYNDREHFLTPRINEFEHILRSRGFKIMHLNWKGDETNYDAHLRTRGRRLSEKGMTPDINSTYPNPGEDVPTYNPGFSDECMYSGYKRFGPTRNQRPNYALSLAENDIVAQNFKAVAAEALALNTKTVVMLGMHTNLCIYNAASLLKISNISIGFVTDLIDAGYYYPKQKHYVASHTIQNYVCNEYVGQKFGWQTMSYSIISAALKMKPIVAEPKWILFPSTARPFKHYYLNTKK